MAISVSTISQQESAVVVEIDGGSTEEMLGLRQSKKENFSPWKIITFDQGKLK